MNHYARVWSCLSIPFLALALLSSGACSDSSTATPAGHPGGASGASGASGSSGSAGASATGGAGGSGATAGTSGTAGQASGIATSDDITILIEPSDGASGIINAISAAQSSVHMVMYLLTDTKVIDALIERHTAGKDVKVLLNKDFTSSATTNDGAFQKLSAAGVPVQWAPAQFALTHEKAVIIDANVAWIMTMNLTLSSPTKNREYLAIDTNAADVAEAEALFEGDWSNAPVAAPAGILVVSPVNSRDRILEVINAASTTLDVEGEELSDNVIVNAILAKADAGVAVRVVLAAGSTSSAQSSAVAKLDQHSIPVAEVSTPYIHAKTIVADAKYAYVGSENFTSNSLDKNRELGIVTAKASEVQKISSTITQDFAAAAH